MSPAKRQLAWTAFWIAACAVVGARRAAPAHTAVLLAAIAAAAALRWALRSRSSYLALAIGVALLGLTASTVANLTAPAGWVVRVAPPLIALTCVFTVGTVVDGLARRRSLAARMAFAAALAVPVTWAVVLMVAYVCFSTATIPLLIVKLNVPDPLGRALEVSRTALQLRFVAPIILGSIAALRATRSA